MEGLLARICRSLRYRVYEKNRRKLGRYRFEKILNRGERYDPLVGDLVGWTEPSHLSRYEFAKRYLTNVDTVLDIACGTGYGTAILSDACLKAVGVDSSRKAVRYANRKYKKGNTEFMVSDIATGTFAADVVVSFETIEHLQWTGVDALLARLASFAGRLLIGSVPYRELPGRNPHHHTFQLHEKSLSSLQACGEVAFFYQGADGEISADKPDDGSVVNLVFVLRKREGG